MTRRRVPACGAPGLTALLWVGAFAVAWPIALWVGLYRLSRPEARPGDGPEGRA